ncbi:hypothetical protein [Mycobacteroides immunogenum]|uniref:Uncharacterized protein n=1 Tax=Mycobacteroides immunogenum TaxID=83262 RepID=A0A7V8LRS5_9MYCO|nr:hypothetical protein [Mycobacteroides immunogenum]AMT70303.1 hypothetical protein ABG82_08150 [Mycobacteroides immunogenum]ANO03368.1 hypothetical protein BAB75_08205 [Mycobacteroides immunogenum]KIU42240.1 hypothetical protein TL11_03435 [Mycobacteroides immunogenum]KPG13390.1 hypothetical protein AN909_03480 [Mycobacteroides immunogenum]KPG14807.1 hypothetical protein AN908_09395 [Mycobacteroides immunogenum]
MIIVAGLRLDATVVKASAMMLYVIGFAFTVFFGVDGMRLAVVLLVGILATILHYWPERERFDRLSIAVAVGLMIAFTLDAWSTWIIDHTAAPDIGIGVVRLVAWLLSVAGILAFPRRLIDREAEDS